MLRRNSICKAKVRARILIFGIMAIMGLFVGRFQTVNAAGQTVNAAGTTYYVATTGINTNPGTSVSPFRTISHAASLVNPGDTVIVKDGTYEESVVISRSGTMTDWITFKSQNKHGAKVLVTQDGYVDGFTVEGNYIEVNGFEITTNGSSSHYGHGVQPINNHHTRVMNNLIHHMGGSGIQGNYMDNLHIEGNITHNNSYWNEWQCSGISIYQARNIGHGSGYRIVVRNNISYSNENKVKSPWGFYTDGNGIIIDDYHNSQGGDAGNYLYDTLVENNLVFDNGGRGIHLFLSDNVTVRNNTAYKNLKNTNIEGTWKGDLHSQDSSDSTWYNNIVYAQGWSGQQAVLIANSSNVSYYNNIIYNGEIYITGTSPTPVINSSTGNLVNVDPKFINTSINPANANFRLQSTSPGINAGTNIFGIPNNDLDYNLRVVGIVDIGAYEVQSGGSTPPSGGEIELNRSGWTVTASNNNSDASKAIDNNQSTRWDTGQTQAAGQWFQIDLGSAETVTKLVLDSENSSYDYPVGYEVYVSDSTSNWGAPVATGVGASTTTIEFGAKSGRYIRIVQTGSASNYWWSIHELYAYASGGSTPPSGGEMELNRSGWAVTASNNNGDASKAIDNNQSTRWDTGQTQAEGQWFQIDLGSAEAVTKLVLDSESSSYDYPVGYEVYVSDSASNWGAPVATGVGAPTTTIEFGAKSGRYIRIVQTATVSTWWWSIHELYAYGLN